MVNVGSGERGSSRASVLVGPLSSGSLPLLRMAKIFARRRGDRLSKKLFFFFLFFLRGVELFELLELLVLPVLELLL